MVFFLGPKAQLLDPRTGEPKGELPLGFPAAQVPMPTGGSFSPDGRRFAALFHESQSASSLLCWDLAEKPRATRIPLYGPYGSPQWLDSRRLILGVSAGRMGTAWHLVDSDRRAVVWRYQIANGSRIEKSPAEHPYVWFHPEARQTGYLATRPLFDDDVLDIVEQRLADCAEAGAGTRHEGYLGAG